MEANRNNTKTCINKSPPAYKFTGSKQLAQSDKEKADTFAKHLADVFKPQEEESDDELPEYPQPPTRPVAPIKPITPKELKTAIPLLHTTKAPGMDLITPTMLKELQHKGILLLTYLFNAILRLHYWPLSLKVAEIILIPKPGKDPTEATSYRPNSLLPTLAKLLEKLILCRIDPDHTAKDWIPHHQFGFRRAHSTIQQCHRITHTILTALYNSE